MSSADSLIRRTTPKHRRSASSTGRPSGAAGPAGRIAGSTGLFPQVASPVCQLPKRGDAELPAGTRLQVAYGRRADAHPLRHRRRTQTPQTQGHRLGFAGRESPALREGGSGPVVTEAHTGRHAPPIARLMVRDRRAVPHGMWYASARPAGIRRARRTGARPAGALRAQRTGARPAARHDRHQDRPEHQGRGCRHEPPP